MVFRQLTGLVRPTRRRWLQYGLRSLLVGTVILCLALGWHVERVRRQREAVAALVEADASIEYFGHAGYLSLSHDEDRFRRPSATIENPETVAEWVEWSTPDRLRTALGIDFFQRVCYVYSSFETDLASTLSHLRDLPGLRSLKLGFVLDEDLAIVGSLASLTDFEASDPESARRGHLAITDAGLTDLARLQNLEYLDLSHNLITDAGLARLAQLKRLKHLALWNTKVGDAGIAHLVGMQDLEYLDLNATKVTDDGLVYLTKLRRLKHLKLGGTKIGDAGLAILTKLPNLESLEVGSTDVTDQGLAPLRSLAGLRELRLYHTAIGDKGLRVVGEMRSLENVDVACTKVTADGLTWLGRRLPKTRIDFYKGDPEADAFGRVQKLMDAGRWRDALDAMSKLDRSIVEKYAYSVPATLMLARCHAQLGQWDFAEEQYRKALEQLPGWGVKRYSYASTVWQELYDWPELYERIARNRPDDVWRWMASAQRAIVEGRWSDAITDYARAVQCPHEVVDVFAANHVGTETHVEFEYGASRILAGELAEHRRVCARLIEAHRQAVVKDAKSANEYKNNLIVAVHLWLLAPQGEVKRQQLVAWSNDVAAQSFPFSILEPLLDCRAGIFQKVLEQEQSSYLDDRGLFWFSCAMAHHHLGHDSEAREYLSHGTLWLDRLTKAVRIHRRYDDAGWLLEGEVLRREAQRLICN